MHTLSQFCTFFIRRGAAFSFSSFVRACCMALPFLFAASLSQAQTFSEQFNQATAGGSTFINSTTTDAAGNSYAVGTFTSVGGVLNLTGLGLSPIGTVDGFIAKFDVNGKAIWAHNFGGPNVLVRPVSIARDASGNVYVGAAFYGGSLTSPAVTKISTTDYQSLADGLVMKLDTNGNLLWVRNFGGTTASVQLGNIAEDSSGNSIVVGEFSVGNMTAPYLAKMSLINYDAFVLKIDTNGNLQWAHNYGGSAAATSLGGIAVDSAQNIYVGGAFSGGSMAVPALSRIGSTDGLMMKLSSGGVTQWARNYGGAGVTAAVAAAAVDSTGNVAMSGYFLQGNLSTPYLPRVTATDAADAFVIKVNNAGAVLWARSFGGPGSGAYSGGVFADNSGNVVVTGTFGGANMTSPAITATGSIDTFAVELNNAGTTVWALNLGAANDYFEISNSGGYFANGTRYILLGGQVHYGTNAGWNGFLIKTPIQ